MRIHLFHAVIWCLRVVMHWGGGSIYDLSAFLSEISHGLHVDASNTTLSIICVMYVNLT